MTSNKKEEGADTSLEALADQNVFLYRYNAITKQLDEPATNKRTKEKAKALAWYASLPK